MNENCKTIEDAMKEAKESHARQFWTHDKWEGEGIGPRYCMIDADALGLLISVIKALPEPPQVRPRRMRGWNDVEINEGVRDE